MYHWWKLIGTTWGGGGGEIVIGFPGLCSKSEVKVGEAKIGRSGDALLLRYGVMCCDMNVL